MEPKPQGVGFEKQKAGVLTLSAPSMTLKVDSTVGRAGCDHIFTPTFCTPTTHLMPGQAQKRIRLMMNGPLGGTGRASAHTSQPGWW